MPDSKITALTSISTSTDPANDPLVIVDVSDTSMAATGTTKKVTLNQLLGASGTATLASATITGDLTVDTSTLKVDSANNRVGIGTASPAVDLHIQAAGSASAEVRLASATRSYNIGSTGSGYGSASNLIIYDLTGAAERYRLDASGNHFWNNVGGVAGTAMTLNATGLGVGASPTTKLDVLGSGDGELRLRAGSDAALIFSETAANKNWKLKPSGGDFQFQYSATAYNSGYSPLMYLTATGNVGIGVTPSAWNSSAKAFEIGTAGNSVFSSAATFVEMTNNAYLDSVSNWVRVNTGNAAARFRTSGSGFLWLQAAAGANPITWTQAMTLDASGNLLVGTTTTSGNAGGLKLSNVSGNRGEITFSNNSGSADYVARFNYGSTPTLVGNITVSSGGTSFVTTSDYRLKQDVQPLVGGLARINALKPSTYKWKADDSNGEGFIAHELADVVPLAVTGEKDAVNEDGSIKPQGVDLSKVVPVLVAAIQELTAEVNALKNA